MMLGSKIGREEFMVKSEICIRFLRNGQNLARDIQDTDVWSSVDFDRNIV